jgi:hypothetical protein
MLVHCILRIGFPFEAPVHHSVALPAASFRFYLAVEILAFGQQAGAASPAGDFHQQVNLMPGAHKIPHLCIGGGINPYIIFFMCDLQNLDSELARNNS